MKPTRVLRSFSQPLLLLLLVALPFLGGCSHSPWINLESMALGGASPAALEQTRPIIASLPSRVDTTEQAETTAAALQQAGALDPEPRLIVQAVVAARLCLNTATADHQINWFATHDDALRKELTNAARQIEAPTTGPRNAALEDLTDLRLLALLDDRERLYDFAQEAARHPKLRDRVRSDCWALQTLLLVANRNNDDQTAAAIDWPSPSPDPGQFLAIIPMIPFLPICIPFAIIWTLAGGNSVH